MIRRIVLSLVIVFGLASMANYAEASGPLRSCIVRRHAARMMPDVEQGAIGTAPRWQARPPSLVSPSPRKRTAAALVPGAVAFVVGFAGMAGVNFLASKSKS